MNKEMNPHYDRDKPENVNYRAEIAKYNAAYSIVINGAEAPAEVAKEARAFLDAYEATKVDGGKLKAGAVVNVDWGSNQVLDARDNADGITEWAQKKLIVDPGHALSLQQHRGRKEEWHVKSGVLTVICDGEIKDYKAGETAYLPEGKPHAMMNRGDEPVTVIETMEGICLESDNDRIMCPNGKAMVPCTTVSQARSCAVYAAALEGMGHPNAHLFQAANTEGFRKIVADLKPSA
jgi:mannose-6-phosphate isomerase-like protein (cupin superfamily)